MPLKFYSDHKRFFFGDKFLSESGLERTHQSLRVGILRGIGALTNSNQFRAGKTHVQPDTWGTYSIFVVFMSEQGTIVYIEKS